MRALLLGAGFSHNWGAPLSSEINGSLLSELHDDAHLADQLRKRPFEELFSGFAPPSDGGDDAAKRQLRLQGAVKATFDRVNRAFHRSDLEFRRQNFEQRFSVAGFLQKFDVIFTLNQDLFLETAYFEPGRYRQLTLPGLQRIAPGSDIWRDNGERTMSFGTSIQPYIKLHGSTNWQNDAGESVLIMGNFKSGAIARFPLLKWYHREFESCLRQRTTKLMVIGYSFQDEHIIEAICKASKDCQRGTFIIDPNGTTVLRDPRMRGAQISGQPREVEEIRIVGELRRTLKEIFSGDRFAIGEIERFLDG